MDGKDLNRRLAHMLDEDTDSSWLDERSTYDHLYEAAVEWVYRTGCLTDSQTITTEIDEDSYALETDFLRLAVRDSNEDYIIRLSDGTTTVNLENCRYDEIFSANQTASVGWPSSFALKDRDSIDIISGTASVAGSATGGKSLLTTVTDVSNVGPGDTVHNTTDGSDGIVISRASSTTVYTALFGGTDNEWDASDSFIIRPGARYEIVLSQPIDSAKTITVQYVKTPNPVYTDYDVYRFPKQYATALIKYAMWAYKYRDKERSVGDAMYQYWDRQVSKYLGSVNLGTRTNKLRVSFKK